MKIYVLRDGDLVNDEAILEAHISPEAAQKRKEELVNEWVDEILRADLEETGLTPEDRKWLLKDTERSIVIEEVELVS